MEPSSHQVKKLRITCRILFLALMISIIFILRPWEPFIIEDRLEDYVKGLGIPKDVDVDVKVLDRISWGVYKVGITFRNVESGRNITVITYACCNGRYIFTNVIDTREKYNLTEEYEYEEKITFTPPKSDRPSVEIYVMPFCPYGRQALFSTLLAYQFLGKSFDLSIGYVIYENYPSEELYDEYCITNGTLWLCSMHGKDELLEAIRQSFMKENLSKFTTYYFCFYENCTLDNVDTCWKECAKQAGYDVESIERAANESAWEVASYLWRVNLEYGIEASPTVFINGMEFYGPWDPNAIKDAICNAYKKPPEECNLTVTKEDISEIYGICGVNPC